METLAPPTPEINIPSPQPERRRLAEAVTHLIDEGALAIRGIRGSLSQRRRKWAGNRLESMDHKDALYDRIGRYANGEEMVGPYDTATGEAPLPRTFMERHVDKKISRRLDKKIEADNHAYRARRVFGPAEELRGLSVKERKSQIKAVEEKRSKGLILNEEAARQIRKIKAEPVKMGERLLNSTSNTSRKRSDRLDRSIEQPVLSRWREWRRGEAIKDIQRHNKNMLRHEAKAEARLLSQPERIEKRDERYKKAKDTARKVARGTVRTGVKGTKFVFKQYKRAGEAGLRWVDKKVQEKVQYLDRKEQLKQQQREEDAKRRASKKESSNWGSE